MKDWRRIGSGNDKTTRRREFTVGIWETRNENKNEIETKDQDQ